MSESESESDASGSRRSSYSSESFHSDDDRESKAKKKDVQQNKGQARSRPPPSQLGTQRNNSRTSSVGAGHQGGNVSNNAARRMLSAGRLKINELRNKVTELTVQLANVQTENKQLIRQQRQQERLLSKYDHQESEAPVIVQRISEEANALREQLRRTKERYESKCEKLRVTSEELDRTQRLLKKMKTLVDDKKLAERDDLSRKLTKAEEDIDVKDVTIRDLYKHIENLQKNHRHEIGIERARHRETQQTLEKMQEIDAKLQMQLKEKEKELGVRNIYTLRQNKPPHRLDNSVHSTPVSSSGSHRLPQKTKLQSIRPLRPTNTLNGYGKRKVKDSQRSESEPSEELNKGRSSAELSRQLEEEQQMLATLQAEQEEEMRLKEDRKRRELERQKRELEREKERTEQERKELEEQRRRVREEAERMTSAEEQERRRQKELLLARMKAIDDGTNNLDDAGLSSQTMNGPTTSKRALAADDDVNGAVFGEYRPSFLAGSTSSAKTKKTSSGKKRDAASRPRNNLLVFDDDLTKPSDAEKSASPDLSFLSSQPPHSEMGAGDRHNAHLLPRRPRQQATTMNGSAGNDLSDEIEEVIL